MTSEKKASTTEQLLHSLEIILFEIGRMEDELRDASRDQVTDRDRRRLRWETHELRRRADFLINWLSEARWEARKH